MNKHQKETGKLMYSLNGDLYLLWRQTKVLKLKNKEAKKFRDLALKQIDWAHTNLMLSRFTEVHDK